MRKTAVALDRMMERNRHMANELDRRMTTPKPHLKAALPTTQTAYSFESPESSSITSAHYDQTTQTLTVTFRRGKTGQKTYMGTGIPAVVWDEFLSAPSKGGYFAAHVRPFYTMVEAS